MVLWCVQAGRQRDVVHMHMHAVCSPTSCVACHVQANVMALDESSGKRGDSKRAAFEAYAEHLEPFHNWLLKNTFQVRHSE